MIQIFRIVVRGVLIVGCAVFAVLLVLVYRGELHLGDAAVVWVAIGQAACTSAEPVRGLVMSWREPHRLQLHADLSRTLQQGAFRIADLSGVPVHGIGLSVFLIPQFGAGWRPLRRLIRHRFDDHPGPSHIRWTIGKGVLGRCWREQNSVYRDLRKVAAQARRPGSMQSLHDKTDTASGMSNAEFDRIARKYAEVYAVPINNAAGRMIGVLSADLPFDRHAAAQTCLDIPVVERAVATIAVVAGRLMS